MPLAEEDVPPLIVPITEIDEPAIGLIVKHDVVPPKILAVIVVPLAVAVKPPPALIPVADVVRTLNTVGDVLIVTVNPLA
jgi:hypothetical protein